MDSAGFKRKLSAILSADVVGYSRLMSNNEETTVLTLNNYKALIFELIERHNGRLVDSPGDNLLAEFVSVVDAVRCAVDIQKELKERNADLPDDRKMEFRIGINTGDVIQDGDRIYGDGVNVAARIESLADPGGICISHTGYDQVKTKLNLDYEYSGKYNVKNITDPIKVYRVKMDYKSAGKINKDISHNKNVFSRTSAITILLLIIIAAGLTGWIIYTHRSEKTTTAAIKADRIPKVRISQEKSKTMAVLPFEDISREKDQEYFVDGLSEEILNSLANIPDLTVIARTSSFTFKDTSMTIQEISQMLGVDHILKGSVRKDGSIVRITARLVSGADGSQLWSRTYNRELKDILDIQEDIATAVAEELKITFGIDRPVFRRSGRTDNVEALELFLVASGQFGSMEYRPALETLDKVIKLDPEYAAAWSLKGRSHLLFAQEIPPERVPMELEAGLRSVKRAVELEPSSGWAHNNLGHVHSSMGNFIEAESAYNKGMELMPSPLHSLDFIMHYSKLGYLKKCDELLEFMRWRAFRDPMVRAAYMLNLGYIGRMEQAEDEYERGRALFGQDWFYGDFNMSWLRLGTGAVSIEEIPEIPMFGPVWAMGRSYIDSPEEGLAELQRLYDDEDDLSSNKFLIIACWAAYFGDPDLALNAMEKSTGLQTTGLYFIWAPLMNDVRKMPRFREFVENAGLVEYWNKYGWPDLCAPGNGGDFTCN